MQNRQCYWCSKTVDKTMNFCSEKCRYEYNTAKSTNQGMYDLKYIERRKSLASSETGCFLLFILLLADFWIYIVIQGFTILFIPLEIRYGDNSSLIRVGIPALGTVLIDLLFIGIHHLLKQRWG
jgi:cellulose synthase/poly-beta-1,6-N-acetylglucosamine synthase-like glycosyltransferase